MDIKILYTDFKKQMASKYGIHSTENNQPSVEQENTKLLKGVKKGHCAK